MARRGECTNKSLRNVRCGMQIYEPKCPCAAVVLETCLVDVAVRVQRFTAARDWAGLTHTTLFACIRSEEVPEEVVPEEVS